MTKTERKDFLKWVKGLSDEELEGAYYDAIYDCLGTQTETMYELGYDMQDIKERENYEKYLRDKADLLEDECSKRNIALWESKKGR